MKSVRILITAVVITGFFIIFPTGGHAGSLKKLKNMLSNLATAQEVNYMDHSTYTEDLKALVEYGLFLEDSQIVKIRLVDKDHYIVAARDKKSGYDFCYDNEEGGLLPCSEQIWDLMDQVKIVGAPVQPVTEELTAEKRALIRQLLDISGAKGIGLQFTNIYINQMKGILKQSQDTKIPEHFWDLLGDEILAFMAADLEKPGGMMDILVPVYHKYYSTEDILNLIDFYNSEIGKKTVSVVPLIMAESQVVSAEYAEKVFPEFEKILGKLLKEIE